jgi:hypothetical protein
MPGLIRNGSRDHAAALMRKQLDAASKIATKAEEQEEQEAHCASYRTRGHLSANSRSNQRFMAVPSVLKTQCRQTND